MKTKLKFITTIFAGLALLFGMVGCALFDGTIPLNEENISRYSYSAGVAAGSVAALAELDTNVVNTTITILEKVDTVIVDIDKTYTEVWMPEIETAIQEAVKEGKLTEQKAVIVRTASLLAVEAVDYMFYKYPTWKSSTILAKCAIDSFVKGFKVSFVPINGSAVLLSADKQLIDEQIYNEVKHYLESKHQ